MNKGVHTAAGGLPSTAAAAEEDRATSSNTHDACPPGARRFVRRVHALQEVPRCCRASAAICSRPVLGAEHLFEQDSATYDIMFIMSNGSLDCAPATRALRRHQAQPKLRLGSLCAASESGRAGDASGAGAKSQEPPQSCRTKLAEQTAERTAGRTPLGHENKNTSCARQVA